MQQVVDESLDTQQLPVPFRRPPVEVPQGQAQGAVPTVPTAGHPQGGATGMSSHIQQAMTTPKPGRDKSGPYEGGHKDRPYISRFSIYSMVPPATAPVSILPRADDVSTILRMLREPQTGAVILSGDPGAGKSTLAALVYYALQGAQEVNQSAVGTSESKASPEGHIPGLRHVVWLSLGPNATLPDVIAAILSGINAFQATAWGGLDFFFLKPEMQMALLVQALRRPHDSAFIVLDQFEELLNPETAEGLAGRGAIALFFEMLRDADIGTSRLLLTSYHSPNGPQNGEGTRIRSYLVSRISIPEGVALLQQCGVQGSHSELSLVWQRCGGHVFALVLFSMLMRLSGFSLSYLLNSPDYAPMWNGEVTQNLIGTIYYFLNPIQRTLMRALCLFGEPVPLDAIATAIVGENEAANNSAAQHEGGSSPPINRGGSPFMTFQHELRALVEMCLVQEQSRGIGQHSYFLHPLLRQYTLEHYLEGNNHRLPGHAQGMPLATDVLGVAAPPNPMLRNPEAGQIALAAGHMRVAAFYARMAQEYCPPRDQRTNLSQVEPILAMIRHLCLGWHWQEAYNLLCAEGLHESMLRWGALNTLIELYTAMLSPLGVLNRPDFAEICGRLGVLYARLGDERASQVYYEQALGVFREIGDSYAEAVTLANEGELFRAMGEPEKARSIFERALVLNRQHGDEHLQSVLLHNLGLLFQMMKDYTPALRCYVEALKLAHRLQEHYNEGMILSNMGFLLYEQGDLPEALALLSYAVQVRQSLHDPAVGTVIDFLHTLEQKTGPEAFARLRSSPATNYNLGTHDLISHLLSGDRLERSSQGTAPTDTQ